jgi:DnaK suppressor protein
MNVDHYKKRLLELEATLSARTERALAGGRAQFIDTAHDIADASAAEVAAESEFTEAERDALTLRQVQEALTRIENGTYGKCLVDGAAIDPKRLDAVPWAEYCLRHQGEAEG